MRALLLALAVSSSSPQQFDLLCNGVVEGMGRPVALHYRVDLAAGKWCIENPCAVRPIAQTLPDVIWFERQEARFPGDQNRVIHYVDRVTGKWTYKLGPIDQEGTCTAASFSGFGELPTKF